MSEIVIDGKRRLALPGDAHRVFLRPGRAATEMPESGYCRQFRHRLHLADHPGLPLAHPVREFGLRTLSVLASVDISFKIVDYFRHPGSVERTLLLHEYYRFLIPFPVFSTLIQITNGSYPRPDRPFATRSSASSAGSSESSVALLAVRTTIEDRHWSDPAL